MVSKTADVLASGILPTRWTLGALAMVDLKVVKLALPEKLEIVASEVQVEVEMKDVLSHDNIELVVKIPEATVCQSRRHSTLVPVFSIMSPLFVVYFLT